MLISSSKLPSIDGSWRRETLQLLTAANDTLKVYRRCVKTYQLAHQLNMTCTAEKRVLIALGQKDGEQPSTSFARLPDPKTGQRSTYLLSGGRVQEINWVKSRYSAWFIGDEVLQDGGLYICTPVDPLFLLLPLLEKARGQRQGEGEGIFCDLEQILQSVEHSAAQQLVPLLPPQQLRCLCEFKAVAGQDYYRLNDQKALVWLQKKVEQTKAALLASAPAPSSFASMEPMALTAYAAGMLGEYLAPAWSARLAEALQLSEDIPAPVPAEAYHPPQSADGEGHRAEKRIRLDPKEAAKLKAAEARSAAKTAKLAKEAKTMRKLSSFFTAKPK